MKMNGLLCLIFCLLTFLVRAQFDSVSISNRSDCTKQALEVESLVPMFFTQGFHVAVGYRFNKWRLRASVINGGNYNAEPAGLKNNKEEFKRYYKTSPGVFLGYNIWKNMDVYTYLEFHTFSIKQKSTAIKKELKSTDFGGGVGYQLFIGKRFYIQPALHIYLRAEQTLDFGGTQYSIPRADLSPVLRLGVRLWNQVQIPVEKKLRLPHI